MPARVPLDVDLEDRVLYGLTPVRLAYLVVAVLTGLAVWSSSWAPAPVRAMAAVSLVGIGAAVSWGSWNGRAADTWIVDVVMFTGRTHRLVWDWRSLRSLARKPGAMLDAAEPEEGESGRSLAA